MTVTNVTEGNTEHQKFSPINYEVHEDVRFSRSFMYSLGAGGNVSIGSPLPIQDGVQFQAARRWTMFMSLFFGLW